MGSINRIRRTIMLAIRAIRYARKNRSILIATMSDMWAQLENQNKAMFIRWQKVYKESGLQELVTVLIYSDKKKK